MQKWKVQFMGTIELDLDSRRMRIQNVEIGRKQLKEISIDLSNEQILLILKQLIIDLELE